LTKIDPQETLDFWKLVRDEVKWRAENHIAAVGNERFRWVEAHPPSWHFLKYYRYMEKYGAVCLGSQYSHSMSGILEYKPDGSIDSRDFPAYPEDTPVLTREDAVRVNLGKDVRKPDSMKVDEYIRRDGIVGTRKKYSRPTARCSPSGGTAWAARSRARSRPCICGKAGLSVIHTRAARRATAPTSRREAPHRPAGHLDGKPGPAQTGGLKV
jgi:hypothetical protein